MFSSLKLFSALCATSVLIGTLAVSNVQAAPQILAIASTTIAIPMQCNRAQCSVELSTICLQEFRASPMIGTQYYAANNKPFILTAIAEDGRKIRLPSNLEMKIATARGHNAVQISIPWKSVRAFAVEQLSISVPKSVTLVPVAKKGDSNPQTELDIELASGPFSELANHIINGDEIKRGTAELINLTINQLDLTGRSSVGIRKSALASLQHTSQADNFSKGSTNLANKLVSQCFSETKAGFQSFRQCLGSSHDQLIGKLNTKYWNILKSGS